MAADFLAGTVMHVGAQTGHHLDDVVARTDADNYALIQVKASMPLGTAANSPLGKALEQVVQQYLQGQLAVNDGTSRPVDPQRDALVLCTDGAAPASVRVHLPAALTRTGSQPPGTPLGHELTEEQNAAFRVVEAHIRRLWKICKAIEPDDEQVRGLLRALRVLVLDLDEGGASQSAAVAELSTVLDSNAEARTAWPVLVAQGQAAAIGRSWRDRAALGVALSYERIHLTPPARYTADIARLRDLSEVNLRTLRSEAVLPVAGGLYIPRSGATRLAAAGDGNVLVIGDAGAGKSAVTQELATLRSVSQQVVVLRASDIAGANRIALSAPLTVVLRSWTGPAALLVVDGVDALRGAEDRETLSTTVAALAGSRWQVAATVRTFDVRNSSQLRAVFAGKPVSEEPGEVDQQLPDVRHLRVSDFTETELGEVATVLPIASALMESSTELRRLLRNPFNLSLVARLANSLSGDRPAQLHTVRTRVGLMIALWRWRVQDHNRTGREALLTRLCREMVTTRKLRVVEAEPTVAAADGAALEELFSAGVLSAEGSGPATGRRVVSYAHNILFDFAAALYLLHDPVTPERLLDLLDTDPSLPLVVRPSFEMLVELLWADRNTGAFWPLCLKLAGSRHVLASLAFAARLLQLIRAADDLAALAPERGSPDQTGGFSPRQEFIRQVTGALQTTALLADVRPSVPPLARLARHLAANADTSHEDAALAINLLAALHRRTPLCLGDPGADDRGSALASLLDSCRTEPQQRERMVRAVARLLPQTIAVGATRDAVIRLLDDNSVLDAWGGTVLIWLADTVVPAAEHDRDLARRLAATILKFTETRDEQVDFVGGALLSLTQSRRDQALHSIYRLSRSFEHLCSADLLLAAEIFCDMLDDGHPPQANEPWPLSIPGGITGWLGWGRDISLVGRGDEGATIATALSAALSHSDPGDAARVVAILVSRLHDTTGWQALMSSSSDTAALARLLLPALESGALLIHPDTHVSSAALLTELASSEPSLAARLEAAVLRAHTLADANGRPQNVKDALIGILSPETITSASLTSRLTELGPDGPPRPLPRPRPTATFGHHSIIDRLGPRGKALSPAVTDAALALDEELNRVTGGADDRPAAERRLAPLFIAADIAFSAHPPVPAELSLLLARAAQVLASAPQTLPSTPLGERVLAVLTAAAGSPQAGELHT
ncbi:hypothetical protein [Micromonospora sp. CB01531]|uniref:hypothetical protein n=1 Tax=Micromonospora sp. CB01531 TaxID=1718947 RepID=UPI000A64BF71|nr:hypothetical protein [Micromonospora sp. CB01531]